MPNKQIFHRCVESQDHSTLRKLVDKQEQFEFLEAFIEESKPEFHKFSAYDPLIRAPFRYRLPIPSRFAARFRPAFFHRNVFYASEMRSTALFETAYGFLRQRQHLQLQEASIEPRTSFCVRVLVQNATSVLEHPEVDRLTDRKDYGPSQTFMQEHRDLAVLLYPSCRCRIRGTNVAVFNIEMMSETVSQLVPLTFEFNPSKNLVKICQQSGRVLLETIGWDQVS